MEKFTPDQTDWIIKWALLREKNTLKWSMGKITHAQWEKNRERLFNVLLKHT